MRAVHHPVCILWEKKREKRPCAIIRVHDDSTALWLQDLPRGINNDIDLEIVMSYSYYLLVHRPFKINDVGPNHASSVVMCKEALHSIRGKPVFPSTYFGGLMFLCLCVHFF